MRARPRWLRGVAPAYRLSHGVRLVALATLLGGAVQFAAPEVALRALGAAAPTPGAAHLCATAGLLEALFGGVLLHALLAPGHPGHHSLAVLWGGLQLFGAGAALSLGVSRGVFAGPALLLAAAHLLCGVLVLAYWRAITRPPLPARWLDTAVFRYPDRTRQAR